MEVAETDQQWDSGSPACRRNRIVDRRRTSAVEQRSTESQTPQCPACESRRLLHRPVQCHPRSQYHAGAGLRKAVPVSDGKTDSCWDRFATPECGMTHNRYHRTRVHRGELPRYRDLLRAERVTGKFPGTRRRPRSAAGGARKPGSDRSRMGMPPHSLAAGP